MKTRLYSFTAGILLLAGQAAYATLFIEVGDATDLLPGQVVSSGTTSISGTLTFGDTADLFAFNWGGGILTIDTLGSTFDTQLSLFDGAGVGIGENDDEAAGCCLSEMSLNLGSGSYFLGMTSFNDDAIDAGGLDIFGFSNTFNDLNGNLIQGPEPNGHGALAGWTGTHSSSNNNYTINFSSGVSSVPEPTTLALMGLGLFGLGFNRRKRI